MKKVIIESPYAGDVEVNVRYARKCVKHSLSLGEAPIASHLLYTQEGILDDDNPEERKLGINAGLAWLDVAELHVFYADLGWSKGMEAAWNKSLIEARSVEIRYILTNDEILTLNKKT